MKAWQYNNQDFTIDDINNYKGFIYIITNKVNGMKYIGKKLFHSQKLLPPLKGYKRKRRVVKQSNWEKYYGSCKYLNDDITKFGKGNFKREIISLHSDRGDLNYNEVRLQILLEVLEKVDTNGERVYYNENICRVYYHNPKLNESRVDNYGKYYDLK